MRPSALIVVAPNVARAAAMRLPIVVLESTVVSHGGLPYPQNLELARAMEQAVRSEGAEPATIAVMQGRACVGLSDEQLRVLAQSPNVDKLSKRDVAGALALRKLGSTTVASTCLIASLALGPCVFATGGLGGVHRGAFSGASPTLDVSADLAAVAESKVAVVCSGVKSILDVRHTLEVLETLSVPVLTLGTSRFPTFFSAAPAASADGEESPLRVDSADEAAAVFAAHLELGLGGLVLAVPPPDPLADAEALIARAVNEMASAPRAETEGKKATPWLLKRVAQLSGGQSRTSNVSLLLNNARVAARVAKAFSAGRRALSTVTVVGGSAVDVRARAAGTLLRGTSVPGQVRVEAGGVGRNVAAVVGLCARALNKPRPLLVTALGEDDHVVRKSLTDCFVRLERCARDTPTPRVVEVHDATGELVFAVADFRARVEEEDVHALQDGGVVVVDGNNRHLVRPLRRVSSKLLYEPASAAKAFLEDDALACLDGATPNERELYVMAAGRGGSDVAEQARFVLDAMCRGGDRDQFLLVSRGARGVSLFTSTGGALDVPPASVDEHMEEEAGVTGAGDAQMGVIAFATVRLSCDGCPALAKWSANASGASTREQAHLPGLGWPTKLMLATKAAARTIRSPYAVRPDLGELLARDLEGV